MTQISAHPTTSVPHTSPCRSIHPAASPRTPRRRCRTPYSDIARSKEGLHTVDHPSHHGWIRSIFIHLGGQKPSEPHDPCPSFTYDFDQSSTCRSRQRRHTPSFMKTDMIGACGPHDRPARQDNMTDVSARPRPAQLNQTNHNRTSNHPTQRTPATEIHRSAHAYRSARRMPAWDGHRPNPGNRLFGRRGFC